MKKNRQLTSAFITVLLLSAVVGVQFISLARANPYTNSQYSGQTGAPSSAKSPVVSISSPENREYNTNCITLTFNASVESFSQGGHYSPLISGMQINKSHYIADWLQNSTQIDLSTHLDPEEESNRLSVSVNLTEIPKGKHVIRVYVFAQGTIVDPLHWYTFETAGYSWVNFTIDTTPPIVSVFPIRKEYAEVGEVPLNFTVNEQASKISYVLDGHDKVTIVGNTTLTGLSEGEHNLKIYATDNAGNTGASEAITFNVNIQEPFPTEYVIIAGASVGFVSFWLIVFSVMFRRKTENHEKTNISGRDDSQKNNIKGGEA